MIVLPPVSVVVPAYNAAQTISETIKALLLQEYPKDKIEIIIVDDGSTDATSEVVKQYPVRYIYQENKGPAAARNTGWKMSNGDIICFTDSDCIPENNWVSKMISRFTSDKIAGVGGSYDIINHKSLLASCVHEEIIHRHLRMAEFVNYLGGFNVSYRRSVLEEIKGFDESYRTASSEDNDIAYRIIKRGYLLIFDKDIRVGHYHPQSLFKYLKRQFYHGYWRMKLYRVHSDMAGGDSYGGGIEFVQPPLAFGTLCLLPLCVLSPIAFLTIGLLLLGLILALPMSLEVINRTGQIKYIALWPVTFLRGYARGLGMVQGIYIFFLKNLTA